MGARISGLGSPASRSSVDELHGAGTPRVPDRIETGTYRWRSAIAGWERRSCDTDCDLIAPWCRFSSHRRGDRA